MARRRTVHCCQACGAQHPRWHGRCPDCGEWESLVEETFAPPVAPAATAPGSRAPGGGLAGLVTPVGEEKPRRLAEIDADASPRIRSGEGELDRVLGGGFVPGSVILLGGDPGIGKSTLALQVAGGLAAAGRSVLYVSGEESAEQIRLRASRLPGVGGGLQVLTSTRVEALAGPLRELAPSVVVIDSIQTIQTDAIESAAGSVAQVRESAAQLAATAKRSNAVLLLIGHVTKDGQLAGPRVLEHLVDVVLTFEGDRHHAFRLLRTVKNRFGSTQEVGVFSMAGHGLEAVGNPSELFLEERSTRAPGSCVVPLLEGSRPMLVELQALVAPAPYGTPRRTTLGLEDARVALLLAVLDRRSRVDLLSQDVYAKAAGGVRVAEPAADLAIALAIASSRLDRAVPPDTAAVGEIGLGGEVRRVARLDARAAEAARLGFRRLLVPEACHREQVARTKGRGSGADPDCELVPIREVAEAVDWLERYGGSEPG
ncbi:MAG: DNA repair protein RadA [Spirochaetaceae bacterium]|nr:DNA repair protein RadA [Spirochaetaceae bacterium]HPG25864.1 DNA repair protein RadA [Myxococcota bacterium]